MTTIGDRFKDYEIVTRTALPRRAWTVIRLDGRAFHSFTRGMQRPFDAAFADAIDRTAQVLCGEVSGTVLAYTQSDEISLILEPGGITTQPWFNGEIQKIVSVTASLAAAVFNPIIGKPSAGVFDSRVFTVPDQGDAANYLIWRQRDATRNSLSMAAQSQFSHKTLQGKSGSEMQDMLFNAGINWNDYPARFKRGGMVVRRSGEQIFEFIRRDTGAHETATAMRSWWEVDAAPHFTFDTAVATLSTTNLVDL